MITLLQAIKVGNGAPTYTVAEPDDVSSLVELTNPPEWVGLRSSIPADIVLLLNKVLQVPEVVGLVGVDTYLTNNSMMLRCKDGKSYIVRVNEFR